MTLGHVMGIPIEETVLQFGSAGVAAVMAVSYAGRARLARILRRVRRRGPA